jgi:2-(1,2-epoxy-1,2-dihydrophenyl)acetyl-CoA isomerase
MNGSDDEVLVVERHDAVCLVTLNRPRVLNVLDERLADALVATFAGIADDPAVRAVVLAGAGRSFMAGGDLTRFYADLDGAPATAALLIDRFHALMLTIKAMRQPVIAAVQGPVAGGGVGLALACDLVIAAEDATFLSAYTKLGTSPDGGTTWSLAKLLGPRRALEFILYNEPMDAATALQLGLVNQVVAGSRLVETAMERANLLARSSATAVASVKRLVYAAAASTFDDQLDREKQAFVAAAGTDDFRNRIRAFVEKRAP